jgi:predicted helicase
LGLNEFRPHYRDPNITKWDIFHYVYAVLHHPEYRERYAANLKRELPRIPFAGATESGRASLQAGVPTAPINAGAGLQPGGTAREGRTADSSAPPLRGSARDDKNDGGVGRGPEGPLYPLNGAAGRGPEGPLYPSTQDAGRDAEAPLYPDDKSVFWAFVEAGRDLVELHVNYEQQAEYPLERVEKGQLNWRVLKMKLSHPGKRSLGRAPAADKTSLVYNDFLTLKGIPPETYEYRLGNRSALEWVIDQYQVSTDKRSGIVNDPNRADDPEYIVRLIGQVITVSLETMKIVKSLPALAIAS